MLQRAERIDSLQSQELMGSSLHEKWHSYECGAREFHRSCQPAWSSQWGVFKVRSSYTWDEGSHMVAGTSQYSESPTYPRASAPTASGMTGSCENCSFLEVLHCIFRAHWTLARTMMALMDSLGLAYLPPTPVDKVTK